MKRHKKPKARKPKARKCSLKKRDKLPTTIEGVEAAMKEVMQKAAYEPPGEILERCPDGSRKVSIPPLMAQLMKLQKQLFTLVFGRPPGPEDPVFWDRDREGEGVFRMPEPDPQETQQDMLRAGVRPEVAYAVSRTGMIVTETNLHLFTEEDLAEWDAAVAEYDSVN
jgi:hypothetical protein